MRVEEAGRKNRIASIVAAAEVTNAARSKEAELHRIIIYLKIGI